MYTTGNSHNREREREVHYLCLLIVKLEDIHEKVRGLTYTLHNGVINHTNIFVLEQALLVLVFSSHKFPYPLCEIHIKNLLPRVTSAFMNPFLFISLSMNITLLCNSLALIYISAHLHSQLSHSLLKFNNNEHHSSILYIILCKNVSLLCHENDTKSSPSLLSIHQYQAIFLSHIFHCPKSHCHRYLNQQNSRCVNKQNIITTM
jgi:hypothetical protein